MDAKMTIPVMHCFDDRYTAPAAVAFLSMLEHADKNYFYKLYVVHSDITEQHQRMLQEVVGRFPNASLEFIVPQDRVDELFADVKSKCHYSKELVFKLTVAELFPQYSHMMIMDVDCLYCDDIARSYCEFLSNSDYMAGHKNLAPISWGDKFEEQSYAENFSLEERKIIRQGVNAAYMIYNLDAMRRDGIPRKAVKYFKENAWRICQPEQDTMNIVCAGKITWLPLRSVICTYLWSVLREEEKPAWAEAMAHPIQLHFPGPFKPWIEPGGVKADLWWGYLARTPFFFEVASQFSLKPRKSTYSFLGKIPFVEIWSRGEVTKVRFARFFNLCKSIPFWRKKK